MTALIMNILTGSVLKGAWATVSKLLDMKNQHDLARTNVDMEKLKIMQGGVDNADKWSKVTRRWLILMLAGTLCFVVIWHVVWRPDQTYTILINKDTGFLWGLFFNHTNKTSIVISAGSLLWNFVSFVEIAMGFYFTKMGK